MKTETHSTLSNSDKAVDPITLEIIRNRLETIADAMQNTLLRSAVSVILKEGEDGSSGLITRDGYMMAQARSNPIHLTVMPTAVQAVCEKYPREEMVPGDVFILNDPYNGGTHLPDILMVMPVFEKGKDGGDLWAFSVSLGHHEDVGGIDPGSMSARSTELNQEGLVIPPSSWLKAYKQDMATYDFVRFNTRTPETVLGDLQAQLATCYLGARSLNECVKEFGLETMQSAIEQLFDQAERLIRSKISEIPDGEYDFEDWAESLTPGMDRLPIHCKVTVKGSDIVIDFAGTTEQQPAPTNVNLAGTASAVHTILRGLTDPFAPLNDGAIRPITVTAPEGCMFNPTRPAAIALRAQVSCRANCSVLGALTKVMPDKVIAASHGGNHVISFSGKNWDGSRYGATDLIAGGLGARPEKDGIDHIDHAVGNCQMPPAEAWENHLPIEIVEHTPIPDSGGAGKTRGGLGVRRSYKMLKGPVTSCHRAERYNSVPWGVLGGLPGAPGRAYIERADGTIEEVPAKQVLELNTGDTIVRETPGGGGYGDPLERDAELVALDVQDRKVTRESAYRDYGVVLDDLANLVEDATVKRRAELAAERGPITWTMDRGRDGRI
ncbi:MAG: hydantoinase B/oxoprolinase family protein [Hyphomicrobiales bacterium]|nr:hydantoinase B/oxoprolinase family protein [Hyphomicrobiales bacterium]MCP5370257.1 hydantoinase B/oxoprolinase family protein [Hyphomicrobiales bacterium]